MTLPGIIQALLILFLSVSSFVAYFRYPRHWYSSLIVGGALILLGLFIISMSWNPPPALSDIWNFRAPDFYQGTIVFSLGVGIALGNISAWLITCMLRLFNKGT